MNTTSFVINGRTAAYIATLPEKQRSSITTLSRGFSYSSPSSTSSAERPGLFRSYTSPAPSPTHKRRKPSRDSPGWYNTEDGMTLEDFARRLETTTKKFERWQGACAQNVVMALMRPTPIVLFVCNPVSLLIWALLALWFVTGGRTSE